MAEIFDLHIYNLLKVSDLFILTFSLTLLLGTFFHVCYDNWNLKHFHILELVAESFDLHHLNFKVMLHVRLRYIRQKGHPETKEQKSRPKTLS